MTKREEFTFQKNIRKDQYAEAAIEGFTDVPEEEVPFFTNLAEEEEEKRIRSKKRLIYSIIASVLILIIATSAYLVVEKKISVKQFKPFKFLNSGIPATPAILPVVTDQQQIDAFKEAESMAGLTIPDIKTIPLLPGIIPDPATVTMPADTLSSSDNQMPATVNTTDTPEMINQYQAGLQPASDSSSAASGRETEISGYGSAEQGENIQQGYVAPQPVNGDNGFNRYIEENMRKPQTMTEGENAVAVVSFVVKTTGNIDGIKVLSSPGEEYTAEAIRLIKEGPAWKPAENNGRIIEDQKMLRIVFK